MTEKMRQQIILPNLSRGDVTLLKGNKFVTAGTGVALTQQFSDAVKTARLTLTSFLVNDLSTNDYGGTQLFTLANTNLLILGAYMSLAVTIAGMTTQACTSLLASVGTVTASNVSLTGTMANLIPSTTGVGAGATGTMIGAGGTPFLIAAGASNAIFLNISQPVTSGTGTATFSGRIDIHYIDLGVG